MGSSRRLRHRDIQRIERLIGECCDLWHDTRAWRTHMFEGLCEFTGAQRAIGGEWAGWVTLEDRILQVITCGWPAEDLARFQRYLAQQEFAATDTAVVRMARVMQIRRDLTIDQQQLVASREWRRSEFYNQHFRPSRIEHRLLSFHPLCPEQGTGGTLHQGITLYRERDRPAFTERELGIVDEFNRRCVELSGSALVTVAADPLAILPSRVGYALLLLLGGDGEKQAAARMGISRHTLHDYVKHLHRHFGVTSRRELLVRCRALVPRARSLVEMDGDQKVAVQIASLPPRARAAMRLLVGGASTTEIARQMQIMPHTVRDYAKRVYAQLGVSSRAELMARCGTMAIP